jgi:hypothetical protein
VFWNSRKTSVTISAELHKKIALTCPPIGHEPGEVVRIRSLYRPEGGFEKPARRRGAYASGKYRELDSSERPICTLT